MPRLYLVRHAEPVGHGTFIGQTDHPLTDNGRAQASALRLPETPDLVYSSPLRRARETAELAGYGGYTVIHDLREIGFGSWEGKTWSQIEVEHPDLAAVKLRDWFVAPPPDGEHWPDFTARVDGGFSQIRRDVSVVAIFAHLVVNSRLHELLGGTRGTKGLGFTQKHAEVLRYEL